MKHVILACGLSVRYKEIQSVTSNLHLLPNLHLYNLGMCIHKSKAGFYTHTHKPRQCRTLVYRHPFTVFGLYIHKPETQPWFIHPTLTCADTHIEVNYVCCMYTLVTGSPTCGLPGCIMQPVPTFVNCVYTIKILQ
jgi:hypothetical protein